MLKLELKHRKRLRLTTAGQTTLDLGYMHEWRSTFPGSLCHTVGPTTGDSEVTSTFSNEPEMFAFQSSDGKLIYTF